MRCSPTIITKEAHDWGILIWFLGHATIWITLYFSKSATRLSYTCNETHKKDHVILTLFAILASNFEITNEAHICFCVSHLVVLTTNLVIQHRNYCVFAMWKDIVSLEAEKTGTSVKWVVAVLNVEIVKITEISSGIFGNPYIWSLAEKRNLNWNNLRNNWIVLNYMHRTSSFNTPPRV